MCQICGLIVLSVSLIKHELSLTLVCCVTVRQRFHTQLHGVTVKPEQATEGTDSSCICMAQRYILVIQGKFITKNQNFYMFDLCLH